MEEISTHKFSPRAATAETSARRGIRDLREWLRLIEAAGELKRIEVKVDLDQELSAIACMAAQREDAPALLFSRFTEPVEGRVLINMLSPGKHGGLDRDAWWKRNQPCPVVVAYGIDPILFMVGAQVFGSQESELDVAGGMMGEAVELTDGVAGELPIPARAEIVIEGVLMPNQREMEGPLGEFTGYYGNARAPQPVIEVKALHMRKDPIITASLMARYPACEIGAYYAVLRSAGILRHL